MKMTLSMPRTISSEISVSSEIRPATLNRSPLAAAPAAGSAAETAATSGQARSIRKTAITDGKTRHRASTSGGHAISPGRTRRAGRHWQRRRARPATDTSCRPIGQRRHRAPPPSAGRPQARSSRCATTRGRRLAADVTAGVTVGLVALPLAMAFAIASGLPPESGIYCAIVTGVLISASAARWSRSAAPPAPSSSSVAGIVATHGVDGLFMCTMMAGVMLVVLGATGMGSAIRFIPRPVVVGFTNGIAVIIASTQIRDFLGLTDDAHARRFRRPHGRRSAARCRPPMRRSAGARVCTLLVLILCATLKTRVPGTILALFAGTLSSHAVRPGGRRPSTRASTASRAAGRVRDPRVPRRPDPRLLTPAFTVAMLGGIESLMSAVVADRHDRRSPQPERRAGRAGRRQHRLAAVRRTAGDRRDRAHRDQRPLRRARRRSPASSTR